MIFNQPEPARPERRRRSRPPAIRAAEGFTNAPAAPARVTVAWTPSNPDSAGLPPIELELVAGSEAASTSSPWVCPDNFGWNWMETIASQRCSEVTLTAQLGRDTPAKHLVLELAELLALTLTDSQPLIRVLFVPTSGVPHVSRRHT